MARIHTMRTGKRRQNNASQGKPQAYNPDMEMPDKPERDRRPRDFAGNGRQGKVTCTVCQAEVSLRKLGSDANREAGEKAADLVTGNHRKFGGTYRVMRGDLLCPGSRVAP